MAPVDAGVVDAGEPDVVCAVDATSCRRNIDCVAGQLCLVDDGAESGCCVDIPALCDDDDDCDPDRQCRPNPPSQVRACVARDTCSPFVDDVYCIDEGHCGAYDGLAYCMAPPVEADVASCRLSARRVVSIDGAAVPLPALAFDVDEVMLPQNLLTLSSDLGVVDDMHLTASCAGPGRCYGTVTASANDVICDEVPAVVYPESAEWQTRVIVLDAFYRRPIVADVVRQTADGTDTLRTDVDGVVTFADRNAITQLSVLSTTHTWVTLVEPVGFDYLIYVEPVAFTQHSLSVRVRGDDAHTSGDLRVAFGGTTVPTPTFGTQGVFGGLRSRPVVGLPGDGITPDGSTPTALLVEQGVMQVDGVRLLGFDVPASSTTRTPLVWTSVARLRLSEVGPLLAGAWSAGDDTGPLTFAQVLAGAFDWGVPQRFNPADVELTTSPSASARWSIQVAATDAPCVDVVDGECVQTATGQWLVPGVRTPDGHHLPVGLVHRSDDVRASPGDPDALSVPMAVADGVEHHPLQLLALAGDDDDKHRYGAIVDVDGAAATYSFLPAPQGTRTTSTTEPTTTTLTTTTTADADVVRWVLTSDAGAWHVYSRAGRTTPIAVTTPAGAQQRTTAVELQVFQGLPDEDNWARAFSSAAGAPGVSGARRWAATSVD